MNKNYTIKISLIVALGGFLMGFDASVISGVVKFIEPQFDLSKIQLGWAVSSLTLTSTLAMMIAGPLSNRYGRKLILKWAAVFYAVSAVGSALAPDYVTLVIARMIGGIGVGASLIIAPMYIAEISPAAIRGRMVSFNQLNIVVGISVAFFTNYLILHFSQLDKQWVSSLGLDVWQWRWMLGLESIPAILYFGFLFMVPESPRWLIMKERVQEARKTLLKVVDEKQADLDILAVKESLKTENNKSRTPLSALFKPALRLVLLIGITVAVVQQITGINSVFFYAPMIFEQTGIGTDAAFSQAILVGLTNLVFTILAIIFIDRFGRKILLLVGLSGIAISMFLLAYGFSMDAADMNPWLILIGIVGFVASFAISIGPVMWVLFSEIFPNYVRGLAISFVGLINSGVSFLVQLVFPWELEAIGSSATFLIYGVFAIIGLVIIAILLPETKGRSLEELEKQLIKR